MVGAYVLAGELGRADGDHAAAFAAHERRMRDFVAANQRLALVSATTEPPRCVSLWNGLYRSTCTVRKVLLYKQSSLW
jgi:hypothetical protein